MYKALYTSSKGNKSTHELVSYFEVASEFRYHQNSKRIRISKTNNSSIYLIISSQRTENTPSKSQSARKSNSSKKMCVSPQGRSTPRIRSGSKETQESNATMPSDASACSFSSSSSSSNRKKHVVIMNANHTGLLAAIYLLRRPGHTVTIFSRRTDIGLLTKDEINRNKGEMIGLSMSGLDAIKSIPGLWEKYLKPVEIFIMDFLPDDSGTMTIDENYLCWALSKYLHENFSNKAVNYGNGFHNIASGADSESYVNAPSDFYAFYFINARLDEQAKTISFKQWYDEDDEDVELTTLKYDLLMK